MSDAKRDRDEARKRAKADYDGSPVKCALVSCLITLTFGQWLNGSHYCSSVCAIQAITAAKRGRPRQRSLPVTAAAGLIAPMETQTAPDLETLVNRPPLAPPPRPLIAQSDLSAQIEKAFSYHPPKADQAKRYEKIRAEAKTLAHLLNEACPHSRERSLAITNLENCVMWANASIARNE